MAITSYKAVVGYYNGAGTPNITTAVTGQLSDGWIPIGSPILTDAYGQCTQMMAKTDATPVIATSAYTVVTAANPQPPDATWDAQGEPLWIDTATYLQAYTKGGVVEENVRELWKRTLTDAGLTLAAGSFEEGGTLTSSSQALLCYAYDQAYTWAGSFPKTVPINSTPDLTGGISAGAWVSVGDTSLRGQISDPDGAEKYPELQMARWRDEHDIRGWGAKGDGSDDTSAINAAGLDLSSAGGGVLKWPSGQYSYTFSPPPYGVMWDMDGPNIKREKLGGSPGAEFQTAKFTYMPGPHPTKQLHAHHIRAISKGSNAIGAPYADYALGLTIEKENWSESSGAPSAGEINGLMILTRNGCLTSDPVKTGGAAILADIGQTKGSGYTQFAEIVNSVFAKGTFGLTKQTNLQLLGIDEKSGDSWGAVLNSVVGSQSGCFRLVGTDAAPWNYIIQSWKNSAHIYYISDLGKHRWRVNGVSMSLEQDSSTGAMVMRNESGSAVEWTTPRGSASLRAINVQSGTAYTINTAEITGDLNKTLVMGNASAITVTLPANAPSGFHCEVIQRDPGQVTFVTASGATLQNVDGHTKTKGQHAVVRLRVRGNGSGQAAIWVLDGSTAA